MAFRARWRELKQEGWTSKRPTGLSDDFTYLMPGKTKKDVRGVDFFVGESELMRYLDQIDLAELAAEKAADTTAARKEKKAAVAKAPAKTKSKPAFKKQAAKSKPAAKKQGAKSKKAANDPKRPRIAKDDSAVPKASSSGGGGLREVESIQTSEPSQTLRVDKAKTFQVIHSVSPHDTTYPEDSEGSNSRESLRDASIGRRNLQLEFNDAHSDSDASRSSDEDYVDSDGSASAISVEDSQGVVEDNGDMGESIEDDPNLMEDPDESNTFAAFDSDAENDDGEDDTSSVDGLDVADVQLPAPPEMRFIPDALAAMDDTASARKAWLDEMSINGWSGLQTYTPYDYMMEPYEPRPASAMATDYPNLYAGESGPTSRALEAAATPSGAFFYFMQPELWEDIAEQTNDYFESNLDERVQGQRTRQVARQKKHPEFKPKTPEQIRNELMKSKDVTARELCIFMGLLIARSIVPNKEKLAHHWKTTDEGALPRGCFGLFMARDRFMHISRNLHFSRNDDERAAKDRAWKLRPVIDALQDRFAAGFMPPAVMAFDEAMLPSRSTFNKMRVYLKDKPHKWGTKLFMLCCSTTAYCIRFEVYCGKKERGGTISSTDCNSGPAAVVRNLQHVFGPTAPPNGQMRLVVIDRFYSSVPLSMQLLTMGFYSIGTVRTDRQGMSTKLIPKKVKGEKKKPPRIPKNRPTCIERGTFIVTDALEIPGMRLLRWWDTRAVHMLTTGGSVEMDRIVRRDKLTGTQAEVACPRVVKDYQTFMGGVDVHDQLRLQRYSLQLCLKYKKYYKSLFLGLVDLAIINAYIVFNARRAQANLPKVRHVKFMKQLHLELCQLRHEDWISLRSDKNFQVTPHKSTQITSVRQSAHKPMQNDEWRPGNNGAGRKRRTRACKVCSLLKGTDNARGGDSSVFCSKCKLPNTTKKPMAWRVFLCEKMRHAVKGQPMSCFDIWHKAWRNGTLAPAPSRDGKKRTIRARAPARENERSEGAEEEGEQSEVESSSGHQTKRARQIMTGEEATD